MLKYKYGPYETLIINKTASASLGVTFGRILNNQMFKFGMKWNVNNE